MALRVFNSLSMCKHVLQTRRDPDARSSAPMWAPPAPPARSDAGKLGFSRG